MSPTSYLTAPPRGATDESSNPVASVKAGSGVSRYGPRNMSEASVSREAGPAELGLGERELLQGPRVEDLFA
jgi:hypothetical protein